MWLLAVVAAQAGGVVAADAGFAFGAPACVGASFALCAAAALTRCRASVAASALGAAFFAVGGLAFERAGALESEPVAWPSGARTTLDASVVDVDRGATGVRVLLDDVVGDEAGAVDVLPLGRARLRLFVDAGDPAARWFAARRIGERVRVRAALRALDGPRNPGAPDRARHARRRGVWADASLAHPHAFVSLAPAPSHRSETTALPGRVHRTTTVERLERLGPGGALLAALGLGEAEALDPRVRDAMERLGLSHLVAVSGLHLALVAALVFGLAGRAIRLGGLASLLDPVPFQASAALGAALLYAVLSGLGVPVRRAWVLLVFAVALHAMGRRSAWLAAWCCAASVGLALDPAALFELGPQLSFGVTAALASARLDDRDLAPGDGGIIARLCASALRLLAVSAVALAASAPLLAAHARVSSSWALLANVVAVPLTAAVLLPLALAASATAAFLPSSAASEAFLAAAAAVAHAFEAGVCAIAERLGPLPRSGRPSGFALGLAGLCVLACVRAPTTALRSVAALACLFVVGSRGGPGVEMDAAPHAAELIALDVGQGDALIVRDANTAIVVDAGWADPDGGFDAGERIVLPALATLGIDRLDLLVVTHADLDHLGGAAALLEVLPVDRVWVPAPYAGAAAFDALRRLARGRGARFEGRGREDGGASFGAIAIDVLWPPRGHEIGDRNESSLVLRVGAGEVHALLMGDAGFETERSLLGAPAQLRADVLKLGHHGSRTATSAAFLAAVDPDWVIVSAGCRVGRALPHVDTLGRVTRSGAQLLWTGRDGAVGLALESPAARTELGAGRGVRRCRASPEARAAWPLGRVPRARGDSRAAPGALPLNDPSRRVERSGNAGDRIGVGAPGSRLTRARR